MSEVTSVATRITNGGRIVIPAEYRRVLGLKEGDQVILSLVDGELRITTRLHELRRAQAVVAQYAKEDKSCWSDELLAERRIEAERE